MSATDFFSLQSSGNDFLTTDGGAVLREMNFQIEFPLDIVDAPTGTNMDSFDEVNTYRISDSNESYETGNNRRDEESALLHREPQDNLAVQRTTGQNTFSTIRADSVSTSNSDLGINVCKPTHRKYAIYAERIKTFLKWPHKHPSAEKMAEAGMFFLGKEDIAKCFYCDGGMKSWEPEDDPWEEHAHHFPHCAFVNLVKGKPYIQEVEEENKMQIDEKKTKGSKISRRTLRSNMLSPRVAAVLEMGFSHKLVEVVVRERLETVGEMFDSAESLFEAVDAASENYTSDVSDMETDEEASDLDLDGLKPVKSDRIQAIVDENYQLKQQTKCKVCLINEVGITLLPCGHLVTCVECVMALLECPVCRSLIRGTVKTFMT